VIAAFRVSTATIAHSFAPSFDSPTLLVLTALLLHLSISAQDSDYPALAAVAGDPRLHIAMLNSPDADR